MRNRRDLPPWLALLFLLLLTLLLLVALLNRPEPEQNIEDSIGQIIESEQIERSLPDPENEMPQQPEPVRVESGLALILDDVGYDLASLKRILALPVPVAIAVIPDAPFARESAEMAHEQGQMVMLHLPMEPTSEKYRNKMTPYFLHEKMSRDELRKTFMRALEKVPHAQGVNNHMGSYLSQKLEQMHWVMQVCQENALFFVDSKTSNRSVAADVAREMNVPWASRQIFLDHDLDPDVMDRAWKSSEQCLANGHRCVVIAHPHRETVAFLEQRLGSVDEAVLTPVKQLLRGGDPVHQARITEEGLL